MSSVNYNSIFEKLKANKLNIKKTSASQRVAKLIALKKAIKKHENAICEALYKDLRKSKDEALLTEILPTLSEINFTTKRLSGWMMSQKVSSHFPNLTGSNAIYYEPKGMCLLIAPWNYPFQLVMSPLVGAIAAGNTCVVKPSELSENTAKIIDLIIKEVFLENEIVVVNGGVEVSQALLDLPFNHIFYTGSTTVGKIVMEKAAKNLASITLELGGKSPVIIDKGVNIKNAAHKIMWAKLLNTGQTCIAPDYAFVHKDDAENFINECINAINKQYPEIENNSNYGKIINSKHFERLSKWLSEAVAAGAKINYSKNNNAENNLFYPVIISEVSAKTNLSCEEIFGPILPIKTYSEIDEVIEYINERENPLALYLFSNSLKTKNKIITETNSGGVCVNDLLLHIANPNLPFGGSNHSGLGNYHGWFSFRAFSNEKAVFKQSKINFTSLIFPPYKSGIINFLKRFF
ncbi:MAG: aldehyde dehydrogenase family protein [Bacteroidota bacterium]